MGIYHEARVGRIYWRINAGCEGSRGIKGALTLYGSGSAADSVNLCKIHEPERNIQVTQSKPCIYFTVIHSSTSHSIHSH